MYVYTKNQPTCYGGTQCTSLDADRHKAVLGATITSTTDQRLTFIVNVLQASISQISDISSVNILEIVWDRCSKQEND